MAEKRTTPSVAMQHNHKSIIRAELGDSSRFLANVNENEAMTELVMGKGSNRSKQKCIDEDEGVSILDTQDNYAWNGFRSGLLCFLSLLLICGTCQADSDQSTDKQRTSIRTWFQDDIYLEYGQPLTLYCMHDESLMDPFDGGKNSSDLVFFRNGEEMQPEYVTVINETAVMMYVEKPAPSSNIYSCKLRLKKGRSKQYKGVSLRRVFVGFKPLEPKKFNCVSQNWENLTCTWEPASGNIPTDFSLYFKLPGSARGRILYSCPTLRPEVKLPLNTCSWDPTTSPPYRMMHEYFTFILNAKNVLGNATFIYRFHHWAHVIPSKPVNSSYVNKTYSSVLLHWKIPFLLKYFPPGLHHRVMYQSQWDGREIWKIRDITSEGYEKYFNLTNLPYANTVYDIRIYMKSAVAIGEDKWSQPNEITIKTAATLPGSPPKTDIGSFEIAGNSSHRDAYIYWQTISPLFENGDNFTYQVVRIEEDGKKVELKLKEITKTYAKFSGLSFNSFKFEIVSTNCKGASKHKTMVYVPSQLEMPREPVAFTKTAFDNGLYQLSWDPSNNTDITNYTIFWCENNRDRPYQCSGYLDWVHVSRNKTVCNITVPDPKKIYQFAIAANTERASSGMVWASCTVIYNKEIGKIRSTWINRIESDSIEVGWN